MNKNEIEIMFDLMKQKHKQGFELLYKNYFRLMYGIAYSVSNQDELSKDAIQNTLMKLYLLDEKKFPDKYHLTWLYTVVKNETLMLLRKEKSSVEFDMVKEVLPQMDQAIEQFVDLQQYYDMISPLNAKQKQIVTLKVLGGMSHKEIAKMLDKPIGTIQWTYNRSIKKLRMILTTLTTMVLLTGSEFIYRVVAAFKTKDTVVESVSPKVVPQQPVDIWIYIFGILCCFFIVAWILFFTKSDKIPTKHKP